MASAEKSPLLSTTSATTPHPAATPTAPPQPPSKCNCQKSRCLKHYCECFAQGRRCQPSTCLCYQCLNLDEHMSSDVVKKAMRKQRSGYFPHTLSTASVTSNVSVSVDGVSSSQQAQQQQQPPAINGPLTTTHTSSGGVAGGASASLLSAVSSGGENSATFSCGGGGDERRERQRQLGCTCKRSKCVRGYCDCFKLGIHCGPACKCSDCCNTVDAEKLRANIFAEEEAALMARVVTNNITTTTTLLDRSKSFVLPGTTTTKIHPHGDTGATTAASNNALSLAQQRRNRRRILHALRRTQSQAINSTTSAAGSATTHAKTSSSTAAGASSANGTAPPTGGSKVSIKQHSSSSFSISGSTATAAAGTTNTKSCKIYRRETRHAFLRLLKKKWGIRKKQRPAQLAQRIDQDVIDCTIDCVLAEAIVMPHNELDVTRRMLRIFADCLQLVLDDNRSNFSIAAAQID